MITKDTISLLIEILQSSSGIFLSVGLAVFTLAYAFIQNKKDYLKDIEDLLRLEGVSASVLRKRNSGAKFIAKMSKINSNAIVLVFISLFGLISSYLLSLFCISDKVYTFITAGILILILSMIVYVLKITFKLLGGFNKRSRSK